MDGEAVEFGTSGYTMDEVFVLYDRDSESIWYPLNAQTIDAVGGARQGQAIEILAEPEPMPLRDWLVMHPGSTVLLPTEQDVEWLRRRAEHRAEG